MNNSNLEELYKRTMYKTSLEEQKPKVAYSEAQRIRVVWKLSRINQNTFL